MLARHAVNELAVELGFPLALVEMHFHFFRHLLQVPQKSFVEETHRVFDATVGARHVKSGPAIQNTQRANAQAETHAHDY